MATGGDDTVLDSRVTCSVCLEPYKGRQPKLLPCSHTFCLPCLKQLAEREKAASLSKIIIEDDDDAQTITCPTCRTPVPVPPGGVERLHNNIYVDGGDTFTAARPLNCDLCEEGQEAKFTCSGCQACFCMRCHRFHNKLCKTGKVTEIQVQEEKASERATSKDTKEALEMLQAVFLKLSGGDKGAPCFSGGEVNALKRFSDSSRTGQGDEEMDIRALTSAVNQLTKRLSETEKTVAELKSQNSVLFRDFNSVNEKNAELERQSKKDRDAVACLERELISLRDKIAILCQDNQQLHNDISKVQGDVSKVQGDVSKVQGDLSNVQAEVSKVQADVSKVQNDVSKVQGDVSKVQGDVSKVQADVSKVQGDVSKVQTDLGKVQASVAKIGDGGGALKPQDDAVLKKEVAELKKASAQTEQDVKLFKDRLGKHVAFHAIKTTSARLRRNQTVICEKVISNIGDGYNSKTGVFTANVSGTYCFFATSGPGCKRGDEGDCALDIVVNDNDIVYLYALDCSTCTAHAVVRINAGDKVWLRVSGLFPSQFGGEWLTSFTGVLVQPDLGF